MKAHDGLRLTVGLAAAVLLASCGTVTGTPRSAAESSSAPPPFNMYGAPHVAHPLEVSKFLKTPCAVISARQLKDLGSRYSLGTKASPGSEPASLAICQFDPGDINPNTSLGSVAFLRGGAGLSGAYASRSSDSIFEETTIEGYPAVKVVVNGQATGCNFTVGLTDRQALDAEFDPADTSAPPAQACPAAQAMATAAVETIKASQ